MPLTMDLHKSGGSCCTWGCGLASQCVVACVARTFGKSLDRLEICHTSNVCHGYSSFVCARLILPYHSIDTVASCCWVLHRTGCVYGLTCKQFVFYVTRCVTCTCDFIFRAWIIQPVGNYVDRHEYQSPRSLDVDALVIGIKRPSVSVACSEV